MTRAPTRRPHQCANPVSSSAVIFYRNFISGRDCCRDAAIGRLWAIVQANRDRGEPRGSAPPTPPDIRVRIRRFAGLSTGDVSHRCRRVRSWCPSYQLRSLRAAPSGLHPSPLLRKPDVWNSTAWSTRGLHTQAFFQRSGLQRNSFRLLCPLLTSALRSGRLTTTSVSLPRHNTDLPR